MKMILLGFGKKLQSSESQERFHFSKTAHSETLIALKVNGCRTLIMDAFFFLNEQEASQTNCGTGT